MPPGWDFPVYQEIPKRPYPCWHCHETKKCNCSACPTGTCEACNPKNDKLFHRKKKATARERWQAQAKELGLFVRGPEQSDAKYWLHVCFDNRFGPGPVILKYLRKCAVEIQHELESMDQDPVPGRMPGETEITGLGYLATPDELSAEVFRFDPKESWRRKYGKGNTDAIGKWAELEAERWMKERGTFKPVTSKAGQFAGTDYLWTPAGGKEVLVEVKSRGETQDFERIFLQVAEKRKRTT